MPEHANAQWNNRMANFNDLNEDQQAVFLAGLLHALAAKASEVGYRPSDGQVIDGEQLVAISRMQFWVASHLEPLLTSNPERYRDDEFEAALRRYATKVSFLEELETRLDAASRWRW